MRVVVVSDLSEARQAIVGALAGDDREVVGVDPSRAGAEIRRTSPHVLVIELPRAGGLELVRTLCGQDRDGGMYVIAIVADGMPARMTTSVIAAGGHDVVCAPYTMEELTFRVDVQRRLRRWMATQAPPPLLPPGGLRSALTDLRAWEYLGDVVIDDLEAMLGRPVALAQGWLPSDRPSRLATISMTLPSEQLELCISIVADATTRRWLGNALLGDGAAPEAALDDVMRELANIAGGALKRAALAEGPVLSTGIPVDGRALPRRELGARSWTIELDDAAQLGVIADVRRRANRRIPASHLAEGMIVVDDLRNDAGVLLLPSGTRLTCTTAQRLSNLLDLTIVEVSA